MVDPNPEMHRFRKPAAPAPARERDDDDDESSQSGSDSDPRDAIIARLTARVAALEAWKESCTAAGSEQKKRGRDDKGGNPRPVKKKKRGNTVYLNHIRG